MNLSINNEVDESKNKEINELKEKLNKAEKSNEQLKNKINELENKLKLEYDNKNKIKSLQDLINKKDEELNRLNDELKNNKNNIIKIQNNQIKNKNKCVTFISNDQKICYGISCSGDSTFAEVEELLYQEYPEYRETNNMFLANGKEVLRFKTIDDNKVGTGRPIMLVKPC